MDERLVALHVDNYVSVSADYLHGFLNAVGAALVVGGGHDSLAAESLHRLADAFVVGGDIYFVNHFRHLFIYSFNYRLASKNGKRFAGETRRCVSCRYNSYKFHNLPILSFDAAKLQIFIEMTKKKEKNS